MAEEWVKQRIDQHTDQIKGLETAQGILAHRVKTAESQYRHLHSCLHEFRGETRTGFTEIHDAMHRLEDRLKDQLHDTDNKWHDRLVKVEASKVEVKPNDDGKHDSFVTLRDVMWVVVTLAAAGLAYFLK